MREKTLYRFCHLSFVHWTQLLKHINFFLVLWANRSLILIFCNQQLTHNMFIIIVICFKMIDSISILGTYVVGKNINYLSMQGIDNIRLVE